MERVKLNIINIPKENADVVIKRIQPFVEKYQTEEKISFVNHGYKSQFDLKALLFSVYTQGLIDSQQLPTNPITL